MKNNKKVYCFFLVKDLCEAVRGPCQIVTEGRGWPSFLTCSDYSLPKAVTESHSIIEKKPALQICSSVSSKQP